MVYRQKDDLLTTVWTDHNDVSLLSTNLSKQGVLLFEDSKKKKGHKKKDILGLFLHLCSSYSF